MKLLAFIVLSFINRRFASLDFISRFYLLIRKKKVIKKSICKCVNTEKNFFCSQTIFFYVLLKNMAEIIEEIIYKSRTSNLFVLFTLSFVYCEKKKDQMFDYFFFDSMYHISHDNVNTIIAMVDQSGNHARNKPSHQL